MQRHKKNYLKHLWYPEYINCEVCWNIAVDVHHIVLRSHFWKNKKEEQDNIENLIGLCRICHEKAHKYEYTKEFLQEIHKKML